VTEELKLDVEGDEPAGDVEINPEVASSGDKQTPESADSTKPKGGDVAPEQSVPLARFQELEAKLKRFAPLESLVELTERDPNLVREIQADALRRELGITKQGAAPVAPTPESKSDDVEKFVEAVTPAYVKDPVRTALAIAQASAKAEADKIAEPVRGMVISLAIQNFKAEMAADPFYRMVAPIFDELVNSIPRASLKGTDDAGLRRILQSSYHAATGLAMRKAYTEAVASGKIKVNGAVEPEKAPNYAGAGGGGSKGGTVKIDRATYEFAKRSGMTDQEIAEMVREG